MSNSNATQQIAQVRASEHCHFRFFNDLLLRAFKILLHTQRKEGTSVVGFLQLHAYMYLDRVALAYTPVQNTCMLVPFFESLMLRKQIAWKYIYSYPLPALAHIYRSKPERQRHRRQHLLQQKQSLIRPADNSLTPNHDTIYSQAELDLSQVMVVTLTHVCLHHMY